MFLKVCSTLSDVNLDMLIIVVRKWLSAINQNEKNTTFLWLAPHTNNYIKQPIVLKVFIYIYIHRID